MGDRTMKVAACALVALSLIAEVQAGNSTGGDATINPVNMIAGLMTYVMLIASLIFIYSWVYGGVGAKFLFWTYFGLIVVLMIFLPQYWDASSLQATLYMSVMGTIAYRAFYACFCLQAPSRFEGDRLSLGSRVDY